MRAPIFAALLSLAFCQADAAEPPIKALLITGGCCHDYKAQKDILKQGLETRLNIVGEHLHTTMPAPGRSLPTTAGPTTRGAMTSSSTASAPPTSAIRPSSTPSSGRICTTACPR
jgi:hypothetical protein